MCVGNFGEGGDESGIDDVLVGYVGEDTEGSYGGYRKHFVTMFFCSDSMHAKEEAESEMVNTLARWWGLLSPTISTAAYLVASMLPILASFENSGIACESLRRCII